MTAFLSTGSRDAKIILVLAPGAGAPASSPWMSKVAELLAEVGLGVVRFDFAYMAERQRTGVRRPPPKAEALVGEYEAAVEALRADGAGRPGSRLLIGGKSLGGRVASLAAQGLFDHGRIAGLVCLGYPFHPPDKPQQLRTAHLKTLSCPTLIVQGERDPFGGPSDVAGYDLSPAISVHWARDGDHDLKPRRSSGATLDGNLAEAVQEIMRFAGRLV
ncbi:alpha/beta family hydrolase [Hyphomicrobium sp. CS1GBMeth3]|uniref:alpha/beta family hydrolase n=1 Tax=Hyphomicrobium sp. CS1GBMeth3 TaxID=1892845 RepID=UPI0009314093|nr:alpha/beta family hydrolase [Hyphomicrobium sp. CS1GBMeth3]